MSMQQNSSHINIEKNLSKTKSSYLPSSCIAPEIRKVSCEPVIDFI